MNLHIDSSGEGPPLVLLHGWAMHSGAWGELPARLARHHRVHAVDLPGHGHSPPLPAFTLHDVVATLDGAFGREGAPLTVLGWSLGALVAMRWALVARERVARLVLVAATPRFVAKADWPHAMAPQTLERFGDELRVAWKETVHRFLSLQVRGSEHARGTLARMREALFAHGEPSPATLADALAVLRRTDLRAEIGSITQPTLVIGGDRDTLVLPGAAAWLADHLPHATHANISGAGHAPFLSHPEAFAAAVEDFLHAARATA
jgi:pimeloyl-[acyl-carrier protein] methyl ester esterase